MIKFVVFRKERDKGMYNIGIIGYGNMASYHVKKIFKPPQIRFCAAYDTNKLRLEKATNDGLDAYENLDEMLNNKEIDVVLVSTPNDSHMELAKKAMEKGKHVICEKPAVLNCEELKKLIAESKKRNVLFTVHQNRRLDQDFQIMKKIYDDNTLEGVFRIETRVQGSREIAPTWRKNRENGGGMLYDWGPHLIDQILYMVPSKVISVYAEFQYLRQCEVDENIRVTMKFENGLSVLVEIGTCNYIMLPIWYMCGKEGSAQIDYWNLEGRVLKLINKDIEFCDEIPSTLVGPSITMAPRNTDTVKEYPLPEVDYDKDLFYKNFVNAIEGKEELFVKPEEVLRTTSIIDLAFESGRDNKVIKCYI